MSFEKKIKKVNIFGNNRLKEFKIPPYSLEAEQSVLGGLMLDNERWDRSYN